MKTRRLATVLRATALFILLAAFGLWVGTGRHAGWTQTSAVELRYDEITGIEYPVRYDTFIAGLELLAAGAGFAAVLGGLSLIRPRRAVAVA